MHLHKKTLRIIEFLVIGVFFGLIEDLIAVEAVSDVAITPRVLLIILGVAVPFAVISELVVDHPRFWELLRLRRKEGENAPPPFSR